MKQRPSIKRRSLLFSIAFFLVILAGGTGAFFFAMRQIVRNAGEQALARLIETKTFQLESSVNRKISISLVMANSPLIRDYLSDPDGSSTEEMAYYEISGYHDLFEGDSIFWVSDKDRRFYIDGGYAYDVDPNDPNQAWYKDTMAGNEPYLFTIGTQTGEDGMVYTNFWLDVPVYDQNRTAIGVVGAGIRLDTFITRLYADARDRQSFYLFDPDYVITGAEDMRFSEEKTPLKVIFGADGTAVIEGAKKAKQSGSLQFFITEHTIYATGYMPILGWYITAEMPITADMYLNTSMTRLFLMMFLVVLIVFIVFNGFILNILKPLLEVEQTARALADMDFTVEIHRFRADEIGSIQRALIKIRDSLRKAMDDLHGNLTNMTANSERLNKVITESSDALSVITGNMDAMESETDTQLASVNQTSNAIDEIIKSIGILDTAVNTQATRISESSTAIEAMVSNIDAIRSVVAGVSKTTDTLSKSSVAGHSMLVKLAEEIKQIQEQSTALENANKTIADITARTNILAMNAAIEAAHAGESGKGFAVVAGEIRKLAELSGKESNAISAEIQKIETEIALISAASSQTVGAMDMMFDEIKDMDNSFAQVNHAVAEQAAGGSQILSALKTVQEMTGAVRDGSKTIHQQSGSIHDAMITLRRISENVGGRAKEVKSASRDIASFLEKTKILA